MILDIDFFKKVNDTYGHDAGDEVLKTFAARVKRKVRGADLMCRLGGEEFVVVMPDTKLEIAQRVGERIRAAVAASPFQSIMARARHCRFRSRCRSASPIRWAANRPTHFCGGPTGRSTCPRTRAATASPPRPRDIRLSPVAISPATKSRFAAGAAWP